MVLNSFYVLVNTEYDNEHGTIKECRSILRDEASVYFNVTAVYV